MLDSFKYAIKSGHGTALIYAVGLGLIASDIIPTPADGLYFRLMAKNKAKLEAGKITPRQYWTRDAALYYGLNPLWWSLVALTVVSVKGSLNDKIKWGIALAGTGAVVGVLNKNINEENIVLLKKP